MNLHEEMIHSNDLRELYKIKRKFVKNENIDEAMGTFMQDIMKYFDFDRVFIGMKASAEKEYIPLVEHLRDAPSNFLGDVLDFAGFIRFTDVKVGENEKEYMKLVDHNNYILDTEYKKISPLLMKMGYVKSLEGVPKESLLFYIHEGESFSFTILERYGEREKLFSLAEREALSDAIDASEAKIKEHTLVERMHNESHMKNAMLKNENMPMCMVEQKSRKVIYYNEIYKQIVPVIHIGAVYDELFSGNEYLGKDYSSELVSNTEHLIRFKNKDVDDDAVIYFIKKVIALTLVDGTEAFMVYIKNTADYIRQLEGVDLLTSAYSEKGFSAHYENAIRNKKEDEYMLCTVDISKFKHINDSKGFSTGNKLLIKIAGVLRKFVRSQELFCRMNGDKFALLLQCNSNDEAKARINSLFDKLEAMRAENFLDVGIIYACGVVSVEKDIEMNLLLDKANVARQSAKGSHKNTISFFDVEMERKLSNEIKIESRIAQAVKDGEFTPYLQPKFNLQTMEICGAEALVRWITPAGMIFPDNFIPLFEKNGFITTLDFIVYKQVMKHIRSCLDRGIKVYPISVNVSRNHIRNKNFTKQIMALVEEYDVPIELLELEITESTFIEDREVLKFFVDNINHIRIKVSIDDFGSAYSSLQVLKDINMDILKIDKGFLDNIGSDREFTKDELVLKNIIFLAKDLNCKVICEGIETQNQIDILKKIGCELGQGYVFAKPMPIEEYEEKYLKIENSK
ncbi:MAG: bifunctional diguanylate cyclase/phosphodiesterase [Bacillota bacterium]